MNTSHLPAQSSPALPLPPQLRLDLLPPEILRDIIEHVAPIPRAFHQYKVRQTILLSLCLTSKLLLSSAQATLFEAIVSTSESVVAQVADKNNLLCHCRWMRLNLSTTDFSRESKLEMDFRVILETATRLSDLSYYGSLRPSTLHIASNITKLHLSTLFLSTTLALPFPHLEELSLHRVATLTTHMTHQTFQDLSSLRHLATDEFNEKLVPSPISSRLISLSVDIETWSTLEDQRSEGHLGNAMILYRCDLSRLGKTLAARSVEHLRLMIDSDDIPAHTYSRAEPVARILNEWNKCLLNAQPPYPLQSLYLPFLDSPKNSLSPLFPPIVQDAVDGLIRTCEMLDIEVILEDPVHDADYDSLISPRFVRRSEIRAIADRGIKERQEQG